MVQVPSHPIQGLTMSAKPCISLTVLLQGASVNVFKEKGFARPYGAPYMGAQGVTLHTS